MSIPTHILMFGTVGAVPILLLLAWIDKGDIGSVALGETITNYADMAWRALGDPRIFPFALCVFAFGLLVPTACTILCVRALSLGGRKTTSDIVLIASGCSLVGMLLFGLALAAVSAAAPFRIGIVAHAGLMFYAGTVFLWGMAHPVLAVLSERLLDRIGGSTLPGKVDVKQS